MTGGNGGRMECWDANTPTMDLDAERERIRQEIKELERTLGPSGASLEATEGSSSSPESDSEDEDDLEDGDRDAIMEVDPGGPDGANGDSEGMVSLDLPRTPETCLQMNLVYQEVLQEKIEELSFLLAQNREQQEQLTWELAGSRGSKSNNGKSMPANMFLGHFMKPYFKDKTSGMGPPANSDTREKANQGIKSFEDLITIKWKTREKELLRQAVVSDSLQHLLQPKLRSLEYLNEKRAKCKDEMGRQILDKQIQEKEREIGDINSMPEESLLGSRGDKHDWEKIANINFEGTRSAAELRRLWQNSEHPSINRKEWSEEEVGRLKEIATRHRCVGWEAIAQELGTQRTAFQCLQTFQASNREFRRSEWTPEEDQMLLQLIQEMRVGNHIPYRKISYYMEGRDQAQLLYRWTKRVDPSLKRGAWTPTEDALLLSAVAKYGERNWYKIRSEVPGRNDNQCRDRYLRALHHDIKKGKWSAEEETRLVELVEKYGVGHWAKIASELPHRSDGQCLSKWKIMLGYGRNRKKREGRRLKRKRGPRSSPCPSETSSDDSELQLSGESSEEEEAEAARAPKWKAAGRWRVPALDLWLPTRKKPPGPRPSELPSGPSLSKGFNVNRKRKQLPGAFRDQEGQPQSLAALGEGPPVVSESDWPKGPEEAVAAVAGQQNPKSARESWRVSLAYVKSVLRSNSYELRRRTRELWRKRHFASASPAGAGPALPPVPARGGQKDGMWKATLYRRLMLAVTPWAGSQVQSWALRVRAQASRRTKAEVISEQLQSAQLTSRPLFTLFIQLLHIDVDGCMRVIQKRKSRQVELLKSVVGNPYKNPQAAASAPAAKAPPSQPPPPLPAKKLIPLKAKEGPVAPGASWEAVSYRPASKPKTVSELLREKRLRAARAAQPPQPPRKLLLVPPLLLSPPVIVQPQRTLAVPPGPALVRAPNPQGPLPQPAVGPPAGPVPGRAALVQERQAPPEPPLPPPPPPPSCPKAPSGPTNSQGPGLGSSSAKEALVVSLGAQGPPEKSAPQAAPALAASRLASPGVAKQVLPVTWVVTSQGLLPLTVVGLSGQGALAAPSTRGSSPNPGRAPEVPPAPVAGPPKAAPSVARPSQEISPLPGPSAPPSPPLPPAAEQPPGTSLPAPSSQGPPPQASPAPAATAAPPIQTGSDSPRPASPTGPPLLPARPPCGSSASKEGTLSPDYSLLSLEEAATVKAWTRGVSGGSPLDLKASLPYLPPFLCTLKTLSALLLAKERLACSAASLLGPEAAPAPDLCRLRALVQHRLRENPAYLQLKRRFLAAFTFPAALAALPPSRVTTTLSGCRWWESAAGGDSSSSSSEGEDEEEEEREEEALLGFDVPDPEWLSMPGIRSSSRLKQKKRAVARGAGLPEASAAAPRRAPPPPTLCTSHGPRVYLRAGNGHQGEGEA